MKRCLTSYSLTSLDGLKRVPSREAERGAKRSRKSRLFVTDCLGSSERREHLLLPLRLRYCAAFTLCLCLMHSSAFTSPLSSLTSSGSGGGPLHTHLSHGASQISRITFGCKPPNQDFLFLPRGVSPPGYCLCAPVLTEQTFTTVIVCESSYIRGHFTYSFHADVWHFASP